MAKKSHRKARRVAREPETAVHDCPIPNLPDKFLWMHVNSGTKIRNVLNYALKELPVNNSILWSAAGQGIGKVITCAEIFKRKNPGLHQMTKLRYVKSKNEEVKGNDDTANPNVPEIHILLSKDPLDKIQPGYQSASDEELFSGRRLNSVSKKFKVQDSEDPNLSLKIEGDGPPKKSSTSKLSNDATEEFAAMGLRTGKKRSHKGSNNTDKNSSGAVNVKNRKKGKN